MRHGILTAAVAALMASVVVALAPGQATDTPPDKTPPKPAGGRARNRPAQGAQALAAKPIDGYHLTALPADIAPTLATEPQGDVQVAGQPRMTQGHPCTLWDNQDIAHYQDMLKTSKPLQDALAKLKEAMDARIARPLGVPAPKKGADGQWEFPGEAKTLYKIHEENANDISDLATLYALSGDAKYGEFARKMLLAYADDFPKYGHPLFKGEPWTNRSFRSERDGRLTPQFLTDGIWLIAVARDYDLVYNLPSWTADEHKQMRENLFEAVAAQFVDPIVSPGSYLDRTHNRSVMATAGVLMAGYACDSQKLIDEALYGRGGTKEKPVGGVLGVHFTDKCISPDGLWNEGSMGYQGMASCGLIDDAEILWHHGIDMYRYNNAILKKLFDSPLLYTYPDLTHPATHDSARGSIIPEQIWATDEPHNYEYAYRRYHDPRYLVPVTPVHMSLEMSVHHAPPSVLFDVDLANKPKIASLTNANFTDVGYGMLKLPGPAPVSLLLEYGPSRSHGHPDKLTIDLFALGDVLIPDPGSIFPYSDPLDNGWYHTTPGHATLVVDQKDQIFFQNRYLFRNFPEPQATQFVFAPGQTIAMQRAGSNTVYPGVTEDRAVFITPEYMADLFAAFSTTSHTYDLGWHIRGTLSADLPLQPMTFPDPVPPGYNSLKNVRHATTDKPFVMTFTRKDNPVRLVAAAPASTDIIVGDGYYRVDDKNESVPAIYQRRLANSALYANAVDYSGGKDPYVKSVTQEGSLDAGCGLLKIETIHGADLAFASWAPGPHTAAGLTFDGQQAFVLMDNNTVRSMYLAGQSLNTAAASLERSEPGLASVERLGDGTYLLSNPSSTPATLTITLPALNGLDAVTLDANNQPAGPAQITRKADSLSLQLPAQGKVQFAPKH